MYNMLLTTTSAIEIWWVSILLHLFNLAILVALLWWLLYKPVKKFIKKRQEYFQNLENENKTESENIEKVKAEYQTLMSQAKQEVARASEIAKTQVSEQKKQIIDEANREAGEILSIAKHEIEKEQRRAKTELKEDVASIATSIAEKIVSRELRDEDNKKIIVNALDQWSEDENRNS